MKTIKIIASAFAALVLAAGCSKEIDPGFDSVSVSVITAGLENTKTALQEDGSKVYWENGDAICVNGTASSPISIDAPAPVAEFSFSSALAESKKSVYPAGIWDAEGSVVLPSQQAAGTDVSFGPGALPMVASAESGNTLTFKSAAALVKLQIVSGQTIETIDYVEFTGAGGEQVCGKFNVDYSTGALTGTSTAAADQTVSVSVGKELKGDPTTVFIAVPAGEYSKGFSVKIVSTSGKVMTKSVGAVTLARGTVYPTPVLTFAPAAATIKDFAQEYVKILDVWTEHVGNINRLSNWELAKEGDEDVVENVHYVPSDYTITVGGKTYTTGDMLETALRSYMLLRGWDGNNTEKAGFGNFPSITPVDINADVPATHGYTFGRPLIESSNGGYLVKLVDGKEIHCQVDPVILDNWAQRSVNYALTHDNVITNMCSYPRADHNITNYSGCFSSGRALLTYAFFFKYMLDNQLDKADALGADVVIRSELFGIEENPEIPDDPEQPTGATIKDFAQEYVKILDVWEQTVGTIDMLKGENYQGGDWNVEDVHYVPSTTTITVGEKVYNTADMFETALRSYLLIRGFNGLDTENYGAAKIDPLPDGAVAMSTTEVPATHGYEWGASPFNETPGNGGHFVMGTKTQNEPCKVKVNALDNWARRSLNYQHGKPITNLCGYSGGQLSGYYGCFCSQRALITYAFFFKYMLDNQLDKADGLTDEIIRTELFGDESGIRTADEFLAWVADGTKDAELSANIDLSGKTIEAAAEITGSLNGRGKTITVSSLATPVLPVMKGDVKKVVFAGSFAATPGAEKCLLAPIGKSYGSIERVTNLATVTLSGPAGAGGATVAGIVSEAYGPLKSCTNEGKVSADASGQDTWTIAVAGVAGFAGAAIESCTNKGEVSLVAGSPLGRTAGMTEVSMKYNPVSSVAGVVAYAVSDANHTVTVKNCNNSGKVSFTYDNLNADSFAVSRSPVAGIVANSGGDITNCHNTGDIYGSMNAADRSVAYNAKNIILHAAGVQGSDYFVKKIKSSVDQNETSVIDCTNSGNIYVDTDMTASNNAVGGVSGWPAAESASVTVIKNCVNSGDIVMKGFGKIRLGGIAGGTNSIEGCTNTGNITVEKADAASIFGLINGFHSQTHTLKNCVAQGKLECAVNVNGLGGLCGGIGDAANTMGEGCKVNVTITSANTPQCGLIVGNLNGKKKNVTVGTTDNPVKVAGSVNGVTATADNFMTLIHNATNYDASVHTFNVVFGN